MRKIFTLFFVALSLTVFAQQQRVAILEPTLSGSKVDNGITTSIRELISAAIVNTNSYTIVERSLVDKVIKEQQFSQSGYVDDSQAIKIGKLSGANKVILSVVSFTENRVMLSIKLLDVTTATIERQKAKMLSTVELLDAVEPITAELLSGTVKKELRLGQVVSINGFEGTIIRLNQDKQSGLVLSHNEASAFDHEAAQRYADVMGGIWRLPTTQEAVYICSKLSTINNFLVQNNAVRMLQEIYWTSSPGEEWNSYYKKYMPAWAWFKLNGTIYYCDRCGSGVNFARTVAEYKL